MFGSITVDSDCSLIAQKKKQDLPSTDPEMANARTSLSKKPFVRNLQATQSLNFLFLSESLLFKVYFNYRENRKLKTFHSESTRQVKETRANLLLETRKKLLFNSDNLYWRKGAHQRNGGKLNPYILIKQYEATKSTDICHSRLCLAKHVCLRNDESSFSF